MRYSGIALRPQRPTRFSLKIEKSCFRRYQVISAELNVPAYALTPKSPYIEGGIMKLSSIILMSILFLLVSTSSLRAQDISSDESYVLRLQRLGTCEGCPAFELRFFADGTSLFIGKDGVRFLGVRHYGIRNRQARPNKIAALHNSNLKNLLDQVLRDVVRASASNRASAARVEDANSDISKISNRTVIEMRQTDSSLRTLAFYDNLDVATGLSALAKKIEDLYPYPLDFQSMPTFYRDPHAIMLWTRLWLHGAGSPCAANPEDIFAILYDDGKLLAYVHSPYQSPSSKPISIGSKTVNHPLYMRVVDHLDPLETQRLSRLFTARDRSAASTKERPLGTMSSRIIAPEAPFEDKFRFRPSTDANGGVSTYRSQNSILAKELESIQLKIRKLLPAQTKDSIEGCSKQPLLK